MLRKQDHPINKNHPINKDHPIHRGVVKRLSKKISVELYKKLIGQKAKIQNRPYASKYALSLLGGERGGDQADQVNRLQEEAKHTEQIQRDNLLIRKIIKALDRMETGDYGVCEQTGDLIELNRLYSIPWTTLSIEGAEIEESEKTFRHVR